MGKEYDLDGELIYEGEFLNGQRNGMGKEYNSDDEVIFEGKYSKGKRLKWSNKFWIKLLLFEYINQKSFNLIKD